MNLSERFTKKREELIELLIHNREPMSPIQISYVGDRLKELGIEFDKIAEDARAEGTTSHHSYSGK